LTTTRLTADNFALASDGEKYAPVAVGEDADRNDVMQQQTDNRKCLTDGQTDRQTIIALA